MAPYSDFRPFPIFGASCAPGRVPALGARGEAGAAPRIRTAARLRARDTDPAPVTSIRVAFAYETAENDHPRRRTGSAAAAGDGDAGGDALGLRGVLHPS